MCAYTGPWDATPELRRVADTTPHGLRRQALHTVSTQTTVAASPSLRGRPGGGGIKKARVKVKVQ